MTTPREISPALAEALAEKGYEALTDVQAAVLDADAAGRDLLVSAQTGSGKTVAFGIAMAPDLLGEAAELPQAGAPMALVIAPTRELALQVQRELGWLYAKAGGRLASCVGGMDARSERRQLERGAHIVVGTPGRLRDHIERRALDLSRLQVAILDEADEMLDFGFKEDLEYILDAAPAERRTLLFSATVSKPIAKLAEDYQRDALRISTVSSGSQHADITYLAHLVHAQEREHAVINVLRYHSAPRALVFCATREAVNRLAARLHNRGFRAVALSGELTQAERTKALQALRDGRATVCVATDVAARGIDLPGLDLVVHAEPPTNAESLLHRSGRTGRAGAKGTSVLLCAPSRKGRVIGLLRAARIEAEWTEPPSAEAVREKDQARLGEHPALSADLDESDLDDARSLIERFGAERVAAAFLSELQHRLPAPEELSPPPKDRGDRQSKERPARRDRDDFDDDGWFEVNLGKHMRAEPRWLVPMLCRIGEITGADIGAIRIEDKTSRFQIAADKREAFKAALTRPRGERDANVHVVEAGQPMPDGPPPKAAPAGGRPAGKPSRADRKPHGKSADKRARKFDDRSDDGPGARPAGKFGRKFEDRPDAKPRARKPHRGQGEPLHGDADGDTRPKRDWAPKSDKGPHKGPRTADAPKAAGAKGGKPFKKGNKGSEGKFAGKPGDKAGGKPGSKPGSRPAAKGAAPKGKGKPRRASSDGYATLKRVKRGD
jgi:ATP-dependent RNA helicase DeaD